MRIDSSLWLSGFSRRGHMDSDVGIPLIVLSTFVPVCAAFLPYSEESLKKEDRPTDLDVRTNLCLIH